MLAMHSSTTSSSSGSNSSSSLNVASLLSSHSSGVDISSLMVISKLTFFNFSNSASVLKNVGKQKAFLVGCIVELLNT